MIVQQGSINTTALVVPGLYVQIVPPQTLSLNGVPTDLIGVVGTAQWGPVNVPVVAGTYPEYAATFGSLQARKYDMGTALAAAVQQGAQNFVCVRVTDGTDVAATGVLVATCLTLTSVYTGTLGNSIVASVGTGSAASTFSITITIPGRNPEKFDNIAGSGNAFWVNAAAAINAGQSGLRGPSKIVTAVAGVGTTTPLITDTITLTGGVDGTATITASVLVGADTTPRKGMYCLRSQGASIGVLADADDPTEWSAQIAFGLSEGVYMIATGPASDTIANAVTAKGTAGVDSYAMKLMFGDWIYWQDQVNNVLRLISPQGFVAGRLANLSPEQSSLNKPLYGVVGSQKSGQPGSPSVGTYSTADLAELFGAGIDVIANPQPGGAFWGVRLGHNSSSNAGTNGDDYTRMTNYIASTLNAGMGGYVGQVVNSTLFQNIRSTLLSFLQNMFGQGMLGSTNGNLPFSVVCDITNNPASRTSIGYVQADVQVTYQAINEKFIVNVQGGQTVLVSKQTLPSGQSN